LTIIGGLTTGALFAAGDPPLAEGALKGAGPERSDGFLCVCISEVTFFKPKGSNRKSKLVSKKKTRQQTASDVLSLVDLSEESRAVGVGVVQVHLTHVKHRWGWRASGRRWRRSTTCSKIMKLEIF